jgi:hypothetical protein
MLWILFIGIWTENHFASCLLWKIERKFHCNKLLYSHCSHCTDSFVTYSTVAKDWILIVCYFTTQFVWCFFREDNHITEWFLPLCWKIFCNKFLTFFPYFKKMILWDCLAFVCVSVSHYLFVYCPPIFETYKINLPSVYPTYFLLGGLWGHLAIFVSLSPQIFWVSVQFMSYQRKVDG